MPGYAIWNAAATYAVGRSTLFVTRKTWTFIVDRARGVLPGSPRQAGVNFGF